jgi:hypothetical protein
VSMCLPHSMYIVCSKFQGPSTSAFHTRGGKYSGLWWNQQLQGYVTWYPSPKRGTAIPNTVTVEFNGEQSGTGYTNGNFLTWNWGASQYLPLDKQFRYLAELGLTGYSQWQLTNSTGPNVYNPSYHDQVHAVGLQAGIISKRLGTQLNFRYLNEFYAANRFRGSSLQFESGLHDQEAKTFRPSSCSSLPLTSGVRSTFRVSLLDVVEAF